MNKEEFLKELGARLSPLRFNRDETIFTATANASSGGRTMIVNGRRIDEPVQQHLVEFMVEFCEAADVTNDVCPISMAQLNLTIKVDGQVQVETGFIAVYEDVDWLVEQIKYALH